MSPTKIPMVPSLSMETASGIRLLEEVGAAGIAPERMDHSARPACSPDQTDTESIAMTLVSSGKSIGGGVKKKMTSFIDCKHQYSEIISYHNF